MDKEGFGMYGKMSIDEENEIPLRDDFIKFPDQPDTPPRLIASRCKACGDIAFPSKKLCGMCESNSLEDYYLSSHAKVHTYTVVYQSGLPGVSVPYVLVVVKFPDDDHLLVAGQLTGIEPENVKVGMEVETIIDVVRTGLLGLLVGRTRNVVGYKFRPVKNGQDLE